MANKSAAFSAALAFTGPTGQSQTLSPPISVAAPYNAQSEGAWDLAALAASGQSQAVPLGPVAKPTGVLIKNNTDCDVAVKLNDNVNSATGTLAGGTATIALASKPNEHLSAELVTQHGTAGILSVRRSGGNVIVESWEAGVGLHAADVSDVRVVQRVGAFTLAPAAAVAFFSPVVAAPTTPLVSIDLETETDCVLAGTVGYFVFGDPT